MRVFVTGATGFVGSAIVRELLDAGHRVIGLARSDAAMASLAALGVQSHRGDLENPDSLRTGVAAADAVIHTAFSHDFANFEAMCKMECDAVEVLGTSLIGSDRPLIITSGTALIKPGHLATEDDTSTLTVKDFPRLATFDVARSLEARGVRLMEVRLSPSVHGDGDHGFVPILINIAREKGESAYIGDGTNRWTAVHRLDAAKVYKLALEHGSGGARYHAVDEEGIAFREIAGVISRRLNVPLVSKSPEDAADHFGWFSRFTQLDCPASSKLTRERLGWQPTQPGLLADLEKSTGYFAALTTA